MERASRVLLFHRLAAELGRYTAAPHSSASGAMNRSRLSVVVSLLALAGACSDKAALQRFTPPDVDARSRNYIGQFVRGQSDSAAERLVVALRTPEAPKELAKIADVIRNQTFDTIRVIGASTNTVNGVRHVNLSYELHSSSGWFLTNVASVDTAGTWLVEGVSARPIAQSLETTAHFSLAGKSALHYLWLLLSAAGVVLSLGSSIFIASRRAMPKRWRWVFLSLVGVGAFRLNWSTGAIDLALLQVQLASAGFLRAGPAAPWIVSFGLPIGALIALARYGRWRAAPTQGEPLLPPAPQAAV
jgi:hypothetical protein